MLHVFLNIKSKTQKKISNFCSVLQISGPAWLNFGTILFSTMYDYFYVQLFFFFSRLFFVFFPNGRFVGVVKGTLTANDAEIKFAKFVCVCNMTV